MWRDSGCKWRVGVFDVPEWLPKTGGCGRTRSGLVRLQIVTISYGCRCGRKNAQVQHCSGLERQYTTFRKSLRKETPAGFEPAVAETANAEIPEENNDSGDLAARLQDSDVSDPDLLTVISAWLSLSADACKSILDIATEAAR